MSKPAASIATMSLLVLMLAAHAEETKIPEVPEYAPNPFKKPPTVVVNVKENITLLERTLYGSVNEDRPEDLRLSALERTIFGVSYPKVKLSLAARTAGLEKVVDRLVAGRKLFEEKHWSEAKTAFSEVLKLLGNDYKSLIRAEAHYRIGMSEYELSNISSTTPGAKVNPVMLRTSKEDLLKAQDYYKAVGQPETSQKISAFIDTFKDKCEKLFLY